MNIAVVLHNGNGDNTVPICSRSLKVELSFRKAYGTGSNPVGSWGMYRQPSRGIPCFD